MPFKLFILFVCYIPVIGTYMPRIGIIDFNLTWLFFAGVIFLWMGYLALVKRKIPFSNKWLVAIASYTTIVIISISWSPYPFNESTIKEFFIIGIVPLFVALMALTLFDEESKILTFIKHIVIAAIILSMASLIQTLVISDTVISSGEAFRASGTLKNANALAIFLVLCIPCVLYAMEKNYFPKPMNILMISSLILGILFTVSRKGIITMAVTFLLYFIFKKQWKKLIVIGLSIIVLFISVSSMPLIYNRFKTDVFQPAFLEKSAMATAGLDMFLHKPILGWGYKGYYENIFRYLEYITWVDKYDAHNIYITVLADYGLLGFIPFILILLYPLFIAFIVLRKSMIEKCGDTYSKDFSVICICSLIAFMICGYYAGGLMYDASILSLLYTQCAFILAIPILRRDKAIS